MSKPFVIDLAPPSAQDLLARFPLPGLILDKDASVLFQNERGHERVNAGWLAGAGTRLVALAGEEQSCVMQMPDPSGRERSTTAYATPLGEQTVVVFDDRIASADSVELQRRIDALEKLSATDRLTGLWNRHHFDDVVARELAFSERERSPVSLLIFDLDHFKHVNDTFGHAVGDDVLRTAAARLREASRPTDLLFRWGGEEFALLAPATSAAAARALAERLRAHLVALPFAVAGDVTVSAGVAEHLVAEAATPWFERADAALYQSKEAGRNRVTAAPGGASTVWIREEQVSALRLVWSDRCVSGDPLIDSEHRALFDACNALVAAMTDTNLQSADILGKIDQVLDALARHFTDEEQVLAQVRYPRLEEHRRLHEKLLESSRQLRDAVHAGTSSAGEVVEFLAFEVVNRHVLRADRQFFPFLDGRHASPAAD